MTIAAFRGSTSFSQGTLRFNATVPPDERVEFAGIDHQLTRVAAHAVADYLQRVDPEWHAAHAPTLELLQAKEMEGLYLEFVDGEPRYRHTAETRAVSAMVRLIRTRFDSERERYLAASSAGELDLAQQHATILVQQADIWRRW